MKLHAKMPALTIKSLSLSLPSILILINVQIAMNEPISLLNGVSNCPKDCECISFEGRPGATCADKNLQQIPSGWALAARVMSLDMSNNQLGSALAGANYLNNRGLTGLETLVLKHCGITEIGSGVFLNMETLKKLDLSHNSLSELPEEMFIEMRALTKLDLSHNSMGEITAATFEHATGLEAIDLSYNRLTKLRINSFAGLPRLRKITLDHNRFTTFTSLPFGQAKALELLSITGNPVNCDCHFRPFALWYKSLYMGSGAACAQPHTQIDTVFTEMDAHEFACAPVFDKSELRHGVVMKVGVPVVVTCPVWADPKPSIKWEYRFNGSKVPVNELNISRLQRITMSDDYTNSTGNDPIKLWRFHLRINDAKFEDLGQYICTVKNAAANGIFEVIDVESEVPIAVLKEYKHLDASPGPTPHPIEVALSRVLNLSVDAMLIIAVIAAAVIILCIICCVLACCKRTSAPGANSASGGVRNHFRDANSKGAYAAASNGYAYQVVQSDGMAPGASAMDQFYGSSDGASHQVRPQSRPATVILDYSEPTGSGGTPAAAVTAHASATMIGSESMPGSMQQDDSGYLEPAADSPRLCSLHAQHQSNEDRQNPVKQPNSHLRHPPAPCDPSEGCHLLSGVAEGTPGGTQCDSRGESPTLVHSRAPLAQAEHEDMKMPLKETAL